MLARVTMWLFFVLLGVSMMLEAPVPLAIGP